MQLSLTEASLTPSPPDLLKLRNDFVEVERHDLDEHSWVELVPGLVANAEELFARSWAISRGRNVSGGCTTRRSTSRG